MHRSATIVPDGHCENHASTQRLAHLFHSPLVLECVWRVSPAESTLLRRAVAVSHGICRVQPRGRGARFGGDFSVLDVESTDLGQDATGSLGIGDELSDDGEWAGGVDRLLRSLAVEGSVAVAEGVYFAAVLVADAVEFVGGAAEGAVAGVYARHVAWMGCEGCGGVVGFPDVHFAAAGA